MEETSEELPNFSLGTDLLARKQPTSKSKTKGNDAVELMHGSILPVTMPPRGFAILLSLGGLFPTPGHVERDNSLPPGLLIYHKYVVLCTKH